MAFGGDAGAAGALLAVGNWRSPLANVVPLNNAYDGASNLILSDANGSAVVGQGGNRQVKSLVAVIADDQTPALGAFVDATKDGSAADTGVLVTAAAAANQHGIPINFGAGRGNWNDNELSRLRVIIDMADLSVPAVDVGGVSVIIQAFGAGNIAIVLKNVSSTDIDNMRIRLEYRHSVEL